MCVYLCVCALMALCLICVSICIWWRAQCISSSLPWSICRVVAVLICTRSRRVYAVHAPVKGSEAQVANTEKKTYKLIIPHPLKFIVNIEEPGYVVCKYC